ncbi:hypothetical protein DRE_00269 [Drechslerella stenobrocha 248]|uniref:Uncharacterized protein n=1 Tax=Drechslerella stenobrocha 248 TaxID=1043628 RepID=W7HZP9_9PEZI|nr:hypothetical protein DRE_00269 [Drechslerella stenobrocha 248]
MASSWPVATASGATTSGASAPDASTGAIPRVDTYRRPFPPRVRPPQLPRQLPVGAPDPSSRLEDLEHGLATGGIPDHQRINVEAVIAVLRTGKFPEEFWQGGKPVDFHDIDYMLPVWQEQEYEYELSQSIYYPIIR